MSTSKKTKYLSILLVSLGLFSLCHISLVFAGNSSQSVLLFGYVPERLGLEVQYESNPSLDIVNEQGVKRKVATITESSNVSSGYEVVIISKNGGLTNNGQSLDYQISYGDNDVNVGSLGSGTVVYSSVQAAQVQRIVDLSINVLPISEGSLLGGTYLDELTLIIRAP